jgi:hypothetical protein
MMIKVSAGWGIFSFGSVFSDFKVKVYPSLGIKDGYMPQGDIGASAINGVPLKLVVTGTSLLNFTDEHLLSSSALFIDSPVIYFLLTLLTTFLWLM